MIDPFSPSGAIRPRTWQPGPGASRPAVAWSKKRMIFGVDGARGPHLKLCAIYSGNFWNYCKERRGFRSEGEEGVGRRRPSRPNETYHVQNVSRRSIYGQIVGGQLYYQI